MPLSKDLKELVVFQAKLAGGIGFAVEDGKITVTDAFYFKDALGAAIPAFDGINNVRIDELKDPEKRQELITLFSEEFDIPQDDTESLIEDGLELAIRNYEYGQRMVKAIKGNK